MSVALDLECAALRARRSCMLRTSIVATAVILAGACGPAPRPALLSSTAAPDEYVVWYEVPTRASGDAPAAVAYRSARLDADGKVLGQRDGAVLIANNAVWTLTRDSHSEPAPSCKDLGDPDGDPEPGNASVEILALVEQGGARTIPLTSALAHDMVVETHELDASSALVASLGPYVFVRGATSIYACGAHPSSDGTAAIIDVRTGREVPGLSKAEQAALQGAANAAVAADMGQGDNGSGAVRFDEGVASYAATEPSWAGGALHARHLWFASTCYACGNGEWDSYTWGTWVESRAWPTSLSGVATIPPAVSAWIAARGGAVGVSWADPALAARAVP